MQDKRYLKNSHFIDLFEEENLTKFDNDKYITERLSQNAFRIVTKENDYEYIYYINTCVLKRHKDEYILNTGGWKTLTTKKWLNEYLVYPYQVKQKNHTWYIYKDNEQIDEYKDGYFLKV